MKFLDKEWKGRNYKLYVQRDKNFLWLNFDGRTWLWSPPLALKKNIKKTGKTKTLISAALPGRIQRIFVKKSDRVKKGQSLLTLSAMKMEYNFKAEENGFVENIFCQEGQTVSLDQKLIEIKFI